MRDDEWRYEKKCGRPKWSGAYDTKCDVRLTKEESRELDRLAELNETTRGAIMRKALRDFIIFNTDQVDEKDDTDKEGFTDSQINHTKED